MPPIFTLYIIASIAGIAAGVPQLLKLISTKQSDEFSLTTWLTWGGVQCVSLLYALEVKAMLYAVMCAIWIIFYAVIITLIIRYRQSRPILATEVADESI